MRNTSDWNFIAMVIALCVVVWAFIDSPKSSEAQAQHAHYCEMVEIHNESEGRYGWPNYDNRECN